MALSQGKSIDARRIARADMKSGAEMKRVTKYQPLLVVMHWLMAALFPIALGGGALVLVNIPNTDPMKVDGLRNHFIGGTLLLVLMLTRLALRISTSHPPAAATGTTALDGLAWLSHRVLYVLVFCQAGSGLVMALQAGLLDVLFGHHGALPADFWAFSMRPVHYVVSRLLMAAIALHVVGALYHTFILRDGLLRRMWFGKRTAAAPEFAPPARSRSPS